MSFAKEEKQLRYEYLKTELGYSLKPVLDAMWTWGADYKVKNG